MPEQAMCDGPQSLSTDQVKLFLAGLAPLAAACGSHLRQVAALA